MRGQPLCSTAAALLAAGAVAAGGNWTAPASAGSAMTVGVPLASGAGAHAAARRGATGVGRPRPAPAVIHSLTVSTTKVTVGDCLDRPAAALTFPNDRCRALETVAVTNTGSAAQILVSAGSATPYDHGHEWTLCSAATTRCSGPFHGGRNLPGTNQLTEKFISTVNRATYTGPHLSATPRCDTAFSHSGCDATHDEQGRPERLLLLGPQSTTDHSASFTTTIVWTAT